METNRTLTKSDLIWSYLSQILNVASGLLILPLILSKLPVHQIAIWYIFMAISALVSLLDFGFQPNLLRNTSFIMSGAKELSAVGLSKSEKSNEISWDLFWSLVITARKVYFIIASVVFLVMLIIGTYYIHGITQEYSDHDYILFSWVCYLFVSVINFYFYYYNPLLLGRGMIREQNFVIVVSKVVYLVLSFFSLILSFGLLGIVISLFVSIIVDRFLARNFWYVGSKEYVTQCNKNSD